MAQSVSMKSFLAIVMFALIGFRFSSAAFIDINENEIPESVEAYKSTLESILREASKQIRENSAFDVNMLHNNLQQENVFDDEQSVTSTEEDVEDAKNELSPIEDNASTENVDSEIGCYWRGLNGKCCQSLRIIGIRVRICVDIAVQPPSYLRLRLKLNGMVIWSQIKKYYKLQQVLNIWHSVESHLINIGVRHRSFNICKRRGPVRFCIKLFNVYISRHYARVCLGVHAKLGWIKFHKNLGCVSRRFALHQNPTIKNEPNPTTVHKKHNDELSSYEYEQNNVLKFEMP